MLRWVTIAAILLFAPSADIKQVYLAHIPKEKIAPETVDSRVLGHLMLAAFADQGKSRGPLQPQSELAIVRYVDGEFCKVVRPLPAWKKGFEIKANQPLDEKALEQAIATHGAAANPGDTVQITQINFRQKDILVEINGGKKHHDWRRHVQIGIGGGSGPVASTQPQNPYPSGPSKPASYLDVEFDGPVPDMSPDDLKKYLSAFLDFSKEHSAAVNWVETLPPDIKQAISDHRALVGMDHDMVLAALGRPDQKVREQNDQGVETEDWIYGNPPAKTVFVTFQGDKVIRVKQFP